MRLIAKGAHNSCTQDLVYYIFVIAIVIGGIIFSTQHFRETIFVYLGLTLIAMPRWRFNYKFTCVCEVLFPIMSASLAVYFDHLITMYNHEFFEGETSVVMYIVKNSNNGSGLYRIWVELSFVMTLYFLQRLVRVPMRCAAVIAPLPIMLLSLADYYTYEFRETEFMPADVYGIKTAFNVATNYTIPVLVPLFFMIIPIILYAVSVWHMKVECSSKIKIRSVRYSIVFFAAVVSCISLYHIVGVVSQRDVTFWADYPTQNTGYITSFTKALCNLVHKKPQGYNKLEFEQLVEQSYSVDVSEASNIIVIMNESYTDLSIFQNELGIIDDYAPFWNSLSKNTIRGYAYSSVYGGGTPNSEFEFLTGVITADLPNGATPYTMYIHHDTYSLASYLGDLGYDTLAMHPYYSNGWSRSTVYPLLGFDDMSFIDDFDYDYDDYLRVYLSDQCAYENLISQLDRAEKTFTFLVTIQNHGGYDIAYDNFPVTTYFPNEGGATNDLNTFVSLLHESDNALSYLINYLDDLDEKYTLLIFGDHQPGFGLPGSRDIGGDAWVVPYLIWTNYDMPQSLIDRSSVSNVTSLNYLALDVLEAAGVEEAPYFQNIHRLRNNIPIINLNGYCDESGLWHSYDDDNPYVNEYFCLQYYTLFDS